MKPGPVIKLKCPHCGDVKIIGSLISGNTFHGVFWSDGKKYFPMLPRESYIQRCGRCQHYYYLNDGYRRARIVRSVIDKISTAVKRCFAWPNSVDEPEYNGSLLWCVPDVSGFGGLSAVEMNEAFDELYREDLSDSQKKNLLLLWIQSQNDLLYGRRIFDSYTREIKDLVRRDSASEKNDASLSFNPAIYEERVRKLISLSKDDDLLVTELYREIMEFGRCLASAKQIESSQEDDLKVAYQIMEQAKQGKKGIFILNVGD